MFHLSLKKREENMKSTEHHETRHKVAEHDKSHKSEIKIKGMQ